MLQSESPEKVILISGSLHSHLPEVLKYPVKKIIYIERDPALAKSEITPADTFRMSFLLRIKMHSDISGARTNWLML